MQFRLRGAASPLVLLLVCALILPVAPAFAQGTDVEQWRSADPALTDNFSRNTGQWTVDKGSDALRTISRGRLIVSIPEEELFRWAALDTGESYADFYVEVDAERLNGPEDGMMGIIFRYADADNFYAFLTSADGYYALVKYVDGELEPPGGLVGERRARYGRRRGEPAGRAGRRP